MSEKTKSKETLVLTKVVFTILLERIIRKFTTENKVHIPTYREGQLYGFGNYNAVKPNLKKSFEDVLKGYINGKYLYNKKREAATGMPFVKISREYKYVFFNYLGFEDVYQFVNQDFINTSDKAEQLELLHHENTIEDAYYVSYYFGEDKKMNKGQVIIYRQWKNIEMKYIYEDDKGKTGVYSFFGLIKHSEGFVFFDTNFYVGRKKNEGAKFIFFIGKSAPHERNFLIGTYSGFDKYDNAIAGKMILKKVNSTIEMEQEAMAKDFDPIISQELNKKRIIVESVIRKSALLFSEKSPYAQILFDISGGYTIVFYDDKTTYKINVYIERNHLNVRSMNAAIVIDNDYIDLLNNGQIIGLSFSINGVFYIQKVAIYVKSYELLENKERTVSGKFVAVDIHNDILSGMVTFERSLI